MDILILDSWLRDYLVTTANPSQIAKYLSLCGPSIERVTQINNDFIYHIEITTNRIDSASVYGIAREASAILPRFGIPARLKPIRSESKEFTFVKKVGFLTTLIDKKLCSRFTTALIKNVKIGDSSPIIKKRLESANIRPINNVVDISNYVMLELGQPVHTFDYDKIIGAKMIIRESRKGEKIITIDGKEFTLPGGDIVIEDGGRRLIDLAGIMGGKLSEVDKNTQNVLLFVQSYNSVNIRKTSMAIAQRTQAATIFEKGTDEETVAPAMLTAIDLFKSQGGCEIYKEILDVYPNPYKNANIDISIDYIISRLGIDMTKKEIVGYLQSLGFECSWRKNILSISIPSWRIKDIKAEEDIVEEIARIYGYHNLPSKIMSGDIPERPEDPRFGFEKLIKNIISGFGGTEMYTLSLVSKDAVNGNYIKLKNPLGHDTEYLRTSLMPSLLSAAKLNSGTIDRFHLFEVANIYLAQINNLPEERLMLAGIFSNYEYRKAKGVVEGLLERLSINPMFKAEESMGFGASKCVYIYTNNRLIGKMGYIENTKLIYYEFEFLKLMDNSPKIVPFNPISKYPSQDEDITFHVPEHTHIIDVINYIACLNERIKDVNFIGDVFNNNYTIHVKYHDPEKTLNDQEVEKVRKEIISSVKNKFGGTVR